MNIEGRNRQHWSDLRKGKHKNPHLQASWNKYGKEFFVFSVVEILPQCELLFAEQRYIDGNPGGYNIGKFADAPARGRKRSPEQCAKMSAARKGKRLSEEHKELLRISSTGRIKSPETRAKLSASQSGKKLSKETRAKISENASKKWRNPEYRSKMLAAQNYGKQTENAKRNRSSAVSARWADPEQRKKLSESRKKMWSDPDFRARMIAIRKEQGKIYRGENWRDRPKKKETSIALQEFETR